MRIVYRKKLDSAQYSIRLHNINQEREAKMKYKATKHYREQIVILLIYQIDFIIHIWFAGLILSQNNGSQISQAMPIFTFAISFISIDKMSITGQLNRTLLQSKLQTEFKQSRTLKQSTISIFDNEAESIMTKASWQQLFFFEFIAVFLFTYGFNCSLSLYESDCQASGALLMGICFSGSLCGANINPVITLSNVLKKQSKYHRKMLIYYLPAQFLGALAGIAWSGFLGHSLPVQNILADGDSFKIISNQIMGVFILVLFTLLLSNPNTTFIQNQLSGYFSIAIFYHIARSFAPLAGFLINPAVTIAVGIYRAINGDAVVIQTCWKWIIGDILGCFFAVAFYTHIYEPIIKQIRELKRKTVNFESVTDQSDISSKGFLND